jgi:hypothetical protein
MLAVPPSKLLLLGPDQSQKTGPGGKMADRHSIRMPCPDLSALPRPAGEPDTGRDQHHDQSREPFSESWVGTQTFQMGNRMYGSDERSTSLFVADSNARKIADKEVDKGAAIDQGVFGLRQPIVVDCENVVIVATPGSHQPENEWKEVLAHRNR